jgi:hypothetical protein
MIFLRDDDHHQSGKTPNFVPSPDASGKFLLSTNEHFHKSGIAVTHSKQTVAFLFNTAERMKRSASAVAHSKSTTAQISVQCKWQLHDALPLAKKVSNSALRTPRA